MEKYKNNLKVKITNTTTIITLLAISMIVTIVGVKYSNRIELTQLQANSNSQMMGYIIHTQQNKTIVIDGGTKADSQNLENNIKQYGSKVDYWFLTHPHKDHVGAFINIVENTEIDIGTIYVSLNDLDWYKQYEGSRIEEIQELIELLQSDKIKDKVQEVFLTQEMQIDNINVQILGVKNPEITENAVNNSSMVIKINVNNKSILFLGDTGVQSGEKLLENSKDKLKADIVQMAHHGQNGVTQEVYKAIQPTICLWPTPGWLWDNDNGGGTNSGDWKTLETRSWMENLKVKQNIVEKDGNLFLTIW